MQKYVTQYILLSKQLSLQKISVISDSSCLKSLASAAPLIPSILTKTPLRYPAVAWSHGDPATLDLQDWPLCMFHRLIGRVDIGEDQLIASDWGLGLSAYQLSCFHATKANSLMLPRSGSCFPKFSSEQGKGPVLSQTHITTGATVQWMVRGGEIQLDPQKSTLPQLVSEIMDILKVFGGNRGHWHRHRPCWCRCKNTGMAFSNNRDADITVALGSSTGLSHQAVPHHTYASDS